MKKVFVQPHFEGARFSEHTLPLEVATDLAAYETLVVELAKHLYKKDHPDRQRIPKGFGADFHLHIERLESGSTEPVLSLVSAGVLAMAGTQEGYFERAREVIAECIAAPENQLPVDFPRELLTHFNRIGRSLEEDETMTLSIEGGRQAVLTPDRRKRLVLAAEQVYEREVELTGSIEEADWERSTFRLRLTDGNRLVVPMPESFHAEARSLGGRYRHIVVVRGIGTFDSWDRMQKIVEVESLDVQYDSDLANRFDDLRALEDGWHDGSGNALPEEALDRVAGELVGRYPEKLPLPIIVPTPEGNLFLEWDAPGDPSLDLCLAGMKADFHAFDQDGLDIEKEFELTDSEDWGAFFLFLHQHLLEAEDESGPWFEAVTEIAGPCVSPGGAGMFAPVSRAAVQKRIKGGNLTAFCFHVTSTRVGLFGKCSLLGRREGVSEIVRDPESRGCGRSRP